MAGEEAGAGSGSRSGPWARAVEVRNRSRGTRIARFAGLADTWWSRLRGLLLRRPLTAGEGLVLTPCRGVHTCGMRAPIDVLLTGDDGRVVAVYRALSPWRRTRYHREARHAVELPPGTAESTGTRVGDVVGWEPAPGPTRSQPKIEPQRTGRSHGDA